MNAMQPILREQEVMLTYRGNAMRELERRDRLEYATEAEIEHYAQALRHEAYRKAIEPYIRAKTEIVCRYYRVQLLPHGELPDDIKALLVSCDEMIAGVAKEFGYALPQEQKP